MNNFRTHYDNLKVASSAPKEVIRAAYKALSQKHHPDRNGNSDESQRAMKIINEAYNVLSNEQRRKEHDDWIKKQTYQESINENTYANSAPTAPVGYMVLSEFSKIKGINESKILDMLRSGLYSGIKVDGYWFISLCEVNDNTNNKATKKGYEFKTWIFWGVVIVLCMIAILSTLSISSYREYQVKAISSPAYQSKHVRTIEQLPKTIEKTLEKNIEPEDPDQRKWLDKMEFTH